MTEETNYILKVEKFQYQWEKHQDRDKTQISNIRLSQQNINYTAKGLDNQTQYGFDGNMPTGLQILTSRG